MGMTIICFSFTPDTGFASRVPFASNEPRGFGGFSFFGL